jgi:hypothetical protein
VAGHRIKLTRELDVEKDKLAPQQKIIHDALVKKAGGIGKEVDRDTFVAELEKSGVLKTTQTVARVVAYYLQDFIKRDLAVSIKPEKPAKEEKAKPGEPSKPGAVAKSPADSAPKPAKAAPAAA